MALIWEPLPTETHPPKYANPADLDWLLANASGPCCWLRYDVLVELAPYESAYRNRRAIVHYTTPNGEVWLDHACPARREVR